MMTPAKTERFEMRLDRSMLDRVDGWRSMQLDLPSRAEAARRLMEAGLGGPETEKEQVKLSDGEKLILVMLCELHKKLDVQGEIDPNFVERAIDGGHYWALRRLYLHDHEDDPKAVSEVIDVLEMWSFIERGYRKLSKQAKDAVGQKAGPLGKHVHFLGFDGNYETEHLGIARFLVNDLEHFTNFKGRDLVTHSPMLDAYRQMLEVFKPLRSQLVGRELDVSEIIEILKAER
jgi:uncharacterized protein